MLQLSSWALSSGKLKTFNLLQIENDQIVDCANPVFILLDPLSSAVLRQIIRLCRMLDLKCALVYTTIAAVVNSAALGLSLDGPDYPKSSVAVNSPGLGSQCMEIHKLSLEFSDFMVFLRAHDLNSDQPEAAFHDLNNWLWEIQVLEEVYSLGNDAGVVAEKFASHFTPVLERKKWLCSNNKRSTACVIFVNDLALIDPIACVEPYIKSNHLLDTVFSELCADGHSLRVTWDSLLNWENVQTCPDLNESLPFEEFTTDLLNTPELGAHVLFASYLLSKEQEALTNVQRDIQDLADAVRYSLPELNKIPRNRLQWAELLLRQVRELLVPVCESGKLDLLCRLEFAMAVSLALSACHSRLPNECHNDSDTNSFSLEKLLMRYERSLIVAAQLDAKLISQLEEPKKCEPIVMQAINQARKLTYLDDIFLFLVYILSLVPPQSPVSNFVWHSMTQLLQTGKRTRESATKYGRGFLVPSCMSVDKLIQNLKALREERRMLPCYNCLWSSQPRYRSPLIQLVSDLRTASLQPSNTSPSLKGLKYHSSTSGSAKWLTGLSRYIPLGGSGQYAGVSHDADYVILVIMGSVSFALARDLLEAAQGHASRESPFRLKIVANQFTGGISGLSGFFKMDN